MAEKNTAVIVSNDQQFISKFSKELEQNLYTVEKLKRDNNWNQLSPAMEVDCYVLDNIDGNFPYEKFSSFLQDQKSLLFILNMGQTPSKIVNIPHLTFNIDSDYNSVPLHAFLKNAGKVMKYEKEQIELASMLLHDVRSPLNSLVGYLELLLNATFGALNDGQKNILEKAMELSDATFDMLEDINEVFRGEQTSFQVEKQPFDLPKILEEVLVNIWVKADHKNIKIKKDISPEINQVLGDDYQIQRVLTNLITNSIKYSPNNSQITIKVLPNPDHHVEVSVSDNGQGVPENQLIHLFDKYYRVKQKQQVKKGYGLGLYISKIIVKAHRGKIWAKNNEAGGLTVTFTLPFVHNKS